MSEQLAPSLVIGTAGHVDHGKSSLILALTGINPDRLAEERRRQMTIELGFATLPLDDGRIASFVDVPGHERFIKTMLAGAGGIDAALLVIAADDGPMPQTREHLAILDQLGIEAGIVALTKSDLVDNDWLELVTVEVTELLAGTTLAAAAVVPVSGRTGAGLLNLRAALAALPPSARPALARPARLTVDRAFTLTGHGTIVTGTLRDGPVAAGDLLQAFPGNSMVKVREVQTHGQPVERAGPGQRVALNLAAISPAALPRGTVLAPPGSLRATTSLDVAIQLLPSSSVALTNRKPLPLTLYLGAQEVPVTVTLIDTGALDPGDSGIARVRCSHPMVARPGDRAILRRPSPSETIGGCRVLDANPAPLTRRAASALARRLQALATASPADVVVTLLQQCPRTADELVAQPPEGLSRTDLTAAIAALIEGGAIRPLPAPTGDNPVLIDRDEYARQRAQLLATVAAFHRASPLLPGMSRPAARRSFGAATPAALADALIESMAADGDLFATSTLIRLPEFVIAFEPDREPTIARFLAAVAEAPQTPPSPASLGITEAEVAALAVLGKVVRVSPEVAFAPAAHQELVNGILRQIVRTGEATIASVRDELGTSRRYAQAILEWMDQQRLTLRVGDAHHRGPAARTEEIAPDVESAPDA